MSPGRRWLVSQHRIRCVETARGWVQQALAHIDTAWADTVPSLRYGLYSGDAADREAARIAKARRPLERRRLELLALLQDTDALLQLYESRRGELAFCEGAQGELALVEELV